MAFSTQVKTAINVLLKPARLQVGTTVLEEQAAAHLRELQARGHWSVPRYDQALTFDGKRHLTFLQEVCSPFKDGYTALPQGPEETAGGFYLRNTWFESVDAEILYSVVRRFRPQRIIEVGSGFSSRLIRKAIGDGGLSTKLTCIDPTPTTTVRDCADEHIASPVEKLKASTLAAQLGEHDILFIDSSHKVEQGTDVPFLFLEVLPRLRRNVLVHVHDIFFPLDYSESILDQGWGWNEQYLVHAFLAYNRAFDLLWPAAYMWAGHQQEILEHIPVPPGMNPPSSLWLRKVE
jgi:hypothetical protein